MDRYTKIVLTLIAIGIWGNLLANYDGGRGMIGAANAQATGQPTKVIIVGVQASANDAPLNVVDVFARQVMLAAQQQSRSAAPSQPPPFPQTMPGH